MAHTKVPWSVIEAQRGFIVTAIDGVYDIAVVRNMGNEDNKANAKLIAASPDLLEALNQCRGCDLDPKTREIVDAAIKKATQ